MIMFIYQIKNKINEKKYIGKTEKTIQSRWSSHCKNAKNNVNRYLYDAMNKYGINNFSVDMIEVCEDVRTLNEREKYWINFYKTTNKEFGYNMQEGGTGGAQPYEIRMRAGKKISIKNTGKKRTDEFKIQCSKRMIGDKNPAKRLEVREKIGSTLKRKYLSGELVSSWKTMKTKEYVSKAFAIKRENRENSILHLLLIKLSSKDISNILEISSQTLHKTMKKVFGITPFKYDKQLCKQLY